jgi:hypothetical protein
MDIIYEPMASAEWLLSKFKVSCLDDMGRFAIGQTVPPVSRLREYLVNNSLFTYLRRCSWSHGHHCCFDVKLPHIIFSLGIYVDGVT